MSIDYSKVQFIGDSTIDRIGAYRTKNTNGPIIVAIPAGSSTSGSSYSLELTNVDGVAGPITLSYSLDNSDYVPATTVQYYYSATFLQYMIDIGVFAACKDDKVYIIYYTENPAAKTVYVNVAREIF